MHQTLMIHYNNNNHNVDHPFLNSTMEMNQLKKGLKASSPLESYTVQCSAIRTVPSSTSINTTKAERNMI